MDETEPIDDGHTAIETPPHRPDRDRLPLTGAAAGSDRPMRPPSRS